MFSRKPNTTSASVSASATSTANSRGEVTRDATASGHDSNVTPAQGGRTPFSHPGALAQSEAGAKNHPKPSSSAQTTTVFTGNKAESPSPTPKPAPKRSAAPPPESSLSKRLKGSSSSTKAKQPNGPKQSSLAGFFKPPADTRPSASGTQPAESGSQQTGATVVAGGVRDINSTSKSDSGEARGSPGQGRDCVGSTTLVDNSKS